MKLLLLLLGILTEVCQSTSTKGGVNITTTANPSTQETPSSDFFPPWWFAIILYLLGLFIGAFCICVLCFLLRKFFGEDDRPLIYPQPPQDSESGLGSLGEDSTEEENLV
nr:hypothetical protein [Macronycteris gammaherpesvirus 1]